MATRAVSFSHAAQKAAVSKGLQRSGLNLSEPQYQSRLPFPRHCSCSRSNTACNGVRADAQTNQETTAGSSGAPQRPQVARPTPRKPVDDRPPMPPKAPKEGETTASGGARKFGDNETFEELMAFSGSAPEIVNGRLAMLGFVATAAAEFSTKQTALDQLLANGGNVFTTIFVFTLASLAPKFIADEGLGELLDAAKPGGMPEQLKFFNSVVERNTGRVAMLGFLGLVLVEVFRGEAFFGGKFFNF
ncbi:early light-induced protein [Klebsormidium nitens]|uniref:Early light-induced protein n=1 Tax=Klebsormidium nitens TaxID=105231 RepID=A0A1Y1HMU4_KLENI|nr:early light-induced protein [Klebsormidium nitens]|eukprot:GAQ79032.1 early light-induced protein [Klebsormidium nitens]